MQRKILRKGLVVGIIILFVGVGVHPITAISDKEETISATPETNTVAPKVEIVEIHAFDEYIVNPPYNGLCFTARYKYIGDEPYTGEIGWNAEAYNMRTGELYTTETVRIHGTWNPGDERCSLGNYLLFDEEYFPTNFQLWFYPIPFGLSKKETYRIWGGWLGTTPSYKRIYSKGFNISPRTIDYPFIENFPLLQRLLDIWRYNLA